MKTASLIVILAILGLFAGCKDKGTQVAEPPGIDPQLIGAWYSLDTMAATPPSPRVVFNGVQFNVNMTIQTLGIETATGRVAVNEEINPHPIFRARDGILIAQYEVLGPPGLRIDTLRYTVKLDKLTLTGRYVTYTYHKTGLGSLLSQPVQSTLRVIIDSTEFLSPRIGSMVPAYIVKNSSSQLHLQATISHGWMSIDIDSFNGPGTYSIPVNKGILTMEMGDALMRLPSDSLETAALIIDTYDDQTLRCSGRFEFSVQLPYIPPLRGGRRLHDGTFSVPVYR